MSQGEGTGKSEMVLQPLEGHLFFLGTVILVGLTAAAIFVWTIDAYLAGRRESLNGPFAAFVCLLALFFAYGRLGRYVTVSRDVGISRPSLLKRKGPLLSWRNITAYAVITEGKRAVGLALTTTRGTVRYMEAKTPGCVNQISSALKSQGIRAQVKKE